MTENANILTTPSVTPSRHQVIALAYDGLCTFEFGVAVEIFGLPRPEMGDNWYQFAVAAVDEGPLCATGGIRLMTDGGLNFSPGGYDRGPRLARRRRPGPRGAVRRAGFRPRPRMSDYFYLFRGVRSRRRRAAQWPPGDNPLALHRGAAVPFSADPCGGGRPYVGDALLMTSAGSAAGIDLCLHLVREDFGSEAANVVARRTVVSPHRDGGQAQQVLRPVARSRESLRLGQLFDYLHQHLAASHTVASLAQRAGMGTRTFCAALRRPPVKRPPAGCWRNDCCAPAST